MNKTSVVLAGLLTSVVANPTLAAKDIRIAHGASPDFHMHKALLEFEKILEDRSNGEFEVEIFPSGQIAGDTGMVEAVQSGIAEIAVEPPSFLAKWDPAFEVAELPFIYPSKDVAFEVLNSEAGDQLLNRLPDLGLIGLGWMEMGERHITNNVRPIETPEDLEDVKLRTMKVPTHITSFEALGANPTPMNFGEVYAALQVGAIDGQENPVSHIYTQKFYEVQDYLSLTGHVLGLYLPVMNIDFYSSLSEEEKNLINQSMQEAIEFDKALVGDMERQYIEEIRNGGTEINRLSTDQKAEFIEAMKPVSNDLRERVGEEIYDMWMSEIEQHS